MATITVQVPDDFACAVQAIDGGLELDSTAAPYLIRETIHMIESAVDGVGTILNAIYNHDAADEENLSSCARQLREQAARLERLAEAVA